MGVFRAACLRAFGGPTACGRRTNLETRANRGRRAEGAQQGRCPQFQIERMAPPSTGIIAPVT